MDRSAGDGGGYDGAVVWARLGDREKAFDWLDRACAVHDYDAMFVAIDPRLDGVRGDPRYEEVLHCIGLPTGTQGSVPVAAARIGGVLCSAIEKRTDPTRYASEPLETALPCD